jgi:hypothetical protein
MLTVLVVCAMPDTAKKLLSIKIIIAFIIFFLLINCYAKSTPLNILKFNLKAIKQKKPCVAWLLLLEM